MLGILVLLAGCQTTSSGPPTGTRISPALANPTPDTTTLNPGLAVDYSNIIANSISDVEVAGRGKEGPPLPHLNWPQTSGRPVMTSTYPIYVSAQIDGYLKFPVAGDYALRLLSNDGVQLTIGNQIVLADPTVHTTRLTGPTTVSIKDAGWYKLHLLYFQKAGSATLVLQWKRPGQADFVPVPDEMFAHTP